MLKPRIDILPKSQLQLWPELAATPAEFILYGGTAIALQLGHRTSVDFDFFGSQEFDPDRLLTRIPYLKNARVIQREASTLTCLVFREKPVQLSFFGMPEIHQIEQPLIAEGPGIKVASLLDLSGMKAAVVQKRAQAKDYIDIDALMSDAKITLPQMLAAGRAIFGDQFEPQITAKALTYFGDGDLPELPADLQLRLKKAATAVDLSGLPTMTTRRFTA
jgi:hypothetical protein